MGFVKFKGMGWWIPLLETHLGGDELAHFRQFEARALASFPALGGPDPEALLAEGGDHCANRHGLASELAPDVVAEAVNPDAGVEAVLPEIGIRQVADEVDLLGRQGQAVTLVGDILALAGLPGLGGHFPGDLLGLFGLGIFLGLFDQGLELILGNNLETGAEAQAANVFGIAPHGVVVEASTLDGAFPAIYHPVLVQHSGFQLQRFFALLLVDRLGFEELALADPDPLALLAKGELPAVGHGLIGFVDGVGGVGGESDLHC